MTPKSSSFISKHENERHQRLVHTTTQQLIHDSTATTQYNQQHSMKSNRWQQTCQAATKRPTNLMMMMIPNSSNAMTLNLFESHSLIASCFKWDVSYTAAKVSTGRYVMQSLCRNRASCCIVFGVSVCLSLQPLKSLISCLLGLWTSLGCILSEIMNVCLFVCLFVCLSVCPSHPDVCPGLLAHLTDFV